MPEHAKAMVTVQAGTGTRLGELLALRVQDVDFLRRSVRVEYQFAPKTTTRADPKTPRSRRVIPVPQFVIDAIAEHLRHHPAHKDGTLFTTSTGRLWTHNFYGFTTFRKAVRGAGLPEDTTPHDLRHFYASQLLAAGISVVTVAARLGHSDPGVTLSTYAHLIENQDESTRKALEAAFARSSVQLRSIDR